MENKPRISRKVMGVIISFMITFGSGIAFYALRDTLFPSTSEIELFDVDHEFVGELAMEVRIYAYVKSTKNADYDIDIEFKYEQNGEETQIQTITVMIKANSEEAFYAEFTNKPNKEGDYRVNIVDWRRR